MYIKTDFKWIHGQDGNPIYEIAKQNNLVREDFQKFMKETFQKKIDRPVELTEKSLHQSTEKSFQLN